MSAQLGLSFAGASARLIQGDARDALTALDAQSVDCCVTSPPYWGLRDYGSTGQIGLEADLDEYVEHLVEVFRGVRRVLREDGTLWLNLGDSYAGARGGAQGANGQCADRSAARQRVRERGATRTASGIKPKDLCGIPWEVAFALRADGWWLRSDIIWHKPNPTPESVTDRPTKAHEYLFLLAKSACYYYDHAAMKEAATGRDVERRNRRDVWTIAPARFRGAHFAVFPPALVEPCVLAGSRVGGVVLDPFAGTGTTGAVALAHGRSFVGIELSAAYLELAVERIGFPHHG